jgi:hexosaminidase
LQVLANVVEPVKGYQRGGQQKWTTLGPLTHLVDAVSADSQGAMQARRLMDGLLSDMPRFAAGREHLRAIFTQWRDSRAALEALIARAPALAEVAPLVADLSGLGAVGLETLDVLALNAVPLESWRDAKVAILDRAARPKAALEFPFLPMLREMVFAAMSQGEMKTLAPAVWRARVKSLAVPPRRGTGLFSTDLPVSGTGLRRPG